MHGGLVRVDDFGLRLVMATFYVIIGGALLFWFLNWIVDTMQELSQMTLEDVLGASMMLILIVIVALII